MPVGIRERCLDRYCANIGGEENYVSGLYLGVGGASPSLQVGTLAACSTHSLQYFYSRGLCITAYNCINAVAGVVYAFALRLCG